MKISGKTIHLLWPCLVLGMLSACSGDSGSGSNSSGTPSAGDGDGDGDEGSGGGSGKDPEAMGGDAQGGASGSCTPGESECRSDSRQAVCSDDGEWEVSKCADQEACVDGQCELPNGWVCVPDSKDCAGNVARTCLGDGSGYEESACPGTTECSEGECFGDVCRVGDTRCTPAALDPVQAAEDALQGEVIDVRGAVETALDALPLGQIETCVDGDSWTVEACPENSACIQSGVDPDEAAAFRDDAAEYIRYIATPNGRVPPPAPVVPDLPEIPDDSVAQCVPFDCSDGETSDLTDVYWETEAETGECGDPANPDNTYGAFVECHGIAPYAPVEQEVTACEGMTYCNYDNNDERYACMETECIPGESRCAGRTSIQYCQAPGWSAPQTCVSSGTCSGSGEYPDRSASCQATTE